MSLIFVDILFFAAALLWILRNPHLNYYRKIGLTVLCAAAFFLKAFGVAWCLLVGIGLVLAIIGWREEKKLHTAH